MDRPARTPSAQSEAGKRLLRRSGRRPDDISSIVLVDERAAHIRSEAILRIAAGISQPWAFLAIFGFPVPLPFRDAVYDLVANNRYRCGTGVAALCCPAMAARCGQTPLGAP